MELRFNIKQEDAQRAEELVQQIRYPAGSIHAQVEYPVLRVVVNDSNVDLNALAKQIETGLRTPTQPVDYPMESELLELKRRAGIQLNEYQTARTFDSLESVIAFLQRFKDSRNFDEFDLTRRPDNGMNQNWELTYTYTDFG